VEVYQGSLNTSQFRVGKSSKLQSGANASALIVAHNHPSGDPTPSPDDVAVTRAVVQAGKLLDIDVLDHLVIGGSRWVSLKRGDSDFLEGLPRTRKPISGIAMARPRLPLIAPL